MDWYRSAARDLPWRRSGNPYEIWVSEIILQQTQVSQGRHYYERFLERFPDVHILAEAKVEEVLKVWQGLGYYSRARNMHITAVDIVTNHGGHFPGNYVSLLKLKGIGPYTAAAIASIAFGEAIPAIDGNVKRVVSRIFGIRHDIKSRAGQHDIEMASQSLITSMLPGDFNQAMMDFGAMVCLPKKPLCPGCPVREHCYAFLHHKQDSLPVNMKKTKIRQRYFYYFIIRHGKNLFIQQRKERDIWHLMYQFPLVESGSALTDEDVIKLMTDRLISNPSDAEITKISAGIKHQLSHQLITARFVHLAAKGNPPVNANSDLIEIPAATLESYAIPRLIEKYIDENGV
ncbi:MAG TPA: A/G-specific adenine glycosylase [Bacteroidales bacterium]|nr:A/G-specific adenine glycosylase [Bacteroidales bacterium]